MYLLNLEPAKDKTLDPQTTHKERETEIYKVRQEAYSSGAE